MNRESSDFEPGYAPSSSRASPIVFLPGGLHLPTIPAYRKVNSVDMGTADKVCVAALALWFDSLESGGFDRSTFAVIEIGSAFSAILVVERGRLVDASAGTRGPIGIMSQGSWDGEVAYWRGPLTKNDLFRGGLNDLGALGPDAFRESLVRHLAGLQAITPFERVYLSGRGLTQSEVAALVDDAAKRFGRVINLPNLSGATVKHAAQGSATPCRRPGGRAVRPAGRVAAAHFSGRIGVGLDLKWPCMITGQTACYTREGEPLVTARARVSPRSCPRWVVACRLPGSWCSMAIR